MPQVRSAERSEWDNVVNERGEAHRTLRRTLRRIQRRTERQTETQTHSGRERQRETERETERYRLHEDILEGRARFPEVIDNNLADTLARISADSAGCDEAHVLSNARVEQNASIVRVRVAAQQPDTLLAHTRGPHCSVRQKLLR